MKGTVKTIPDGKSFGFISADITKTELFFHREDFAGFWEDLVKDHARGKNHIPVEFEAINSPKGPRASNVKRLDFPNQSV